MWSKIIVNKVFGFVVGMIPGAKLTKDEEDAVAPTIRKQVAITQADLERTDDNDHPTS